MYQVIINDKYYINDIDIGSQYCDGEVALIYGFETTTDRCEGKFFEYKNMAESVAEQVGGKVIEYIKKKDIQVEVKCNIDMEEVCKQLEKLKYE